MRLPYGPLPVVVPEPATTQPTPVSLRSRASSTTAPLEAALDSSLSQRAYHGSLREIREGVDTLSRRVAGLQERISANTKAEKRLLTRERHLAVWAVGRHEKSSLAETRQRLSRIRKQLASDQKALATEAAVLSAWVGAEASSSSSSSSCSCSCSCSCSSCSSCSSAANAFVADAPTTTARAARGDPPQRTLVHDVDEVRWALDELAQQVRALNNEKTRVRRLAYQEWCHNNGGDEMPDALGWTPNYYPIAKDKQVISEKQMYFESEIARLNEAIDVGVKTHGELTEQLAQYANAPAALEALRRARSLTAAEKTYERSIPRAIEAAQIEHRKLAALDGELYSKNPWVYVSPTGDPVKDHVGTAVIVGCTMAGMPWVGAVASGAVVARVNHGDLKDMATGMALSAAAGYAGGAVAGKVANLAGMDPASLRVALMRGGFSGSVSGATGAAHSGESVPQGAARGAVEGAALSGAVWKARAINTDRFIHKHVDFCDAYAPEQRAALDTAIRQAGQSPVGQRMFDRYRRKGETLYLAPEKDSPVPVPGPHVTGGTNNLYFDGLFEKSALKKYLPRATDGVVFTHELGHTKTAYALPDPANVALVENRFRHWNGIPRRAGYMGPSDVPRMLGSKLLFTW